MADRNWTLDEKMLALMLLPWDIQVTREEDGSLFAQVTEVRDAVADGDNERQLAAELWDSLYESLRVRLEKADAIPLPDGCDLPWTISAMPKRPIQRTAVTAQLVRRAYRRALAVPTAAAGDFVLAGVA